MKNSVRTRLRWIRGFYKVTVPSRARKASNAHSDWLISREEQSRTVIIGQLVEALQLATTDQGGHFEQE